MRFHPALRVTTAVATGTVLVLGAAASAGAGTGHAGRGEGAQLTLTRIGTIDQEGSVTVGGTYRCVETRQREATYVSADLVRGDSQRPVASNIGSGQRVRCDGVTHRWTVSGRPPLGGGEPGSVRVRATLLALPLDTLPLPSVLAVTEQQLRIEQVGGERATHG